MNTLTLERLFAEFRSASEYTPEHATAFFEKYAGYLERVDAVPKSTDLMLYIELAWQRLHMLYQKDNYAAVFGASVTYLAIIKRESHRLGCDLVGNEWHDGIHFLRGMAAYQLGEYPVSTPIFKRLMHAHYNMETFRIWYRYSVYQQSRRMSKIITIVCAIIMLIELPFKKQITSNVLGMVLLGVALIAMTISICYDLYMKRAIKKVGPLRD